MTVLLFTASRDSETVKMLSQDTVLMLNYSDILFILIHLFEVVDTLR